MLEAKSTASFGRDVKRMQRKHRDLTKLKQVMQLILMDTDTAKDELRRRHNAHRLSGEWADTRECHIANEGDWLLLWIRNTTTVTFVRTGSHDDLFN